MRKNDVSAALATAVPMPEGKLTRSEVARRLGVSRTTLRRFEGTALHPVPGPRGVRFFEESEVQAYLIAYRGTRGTTEASTDDSAGDHAAEAFERFDHGATPVDVVKTLRLEPERVAALHDAWFRMKQPPRPLREGDVAARAFEMFAAGKSCRDVAIQLCQPARVVLAFYRDFQSLDAADDVDLPGDVLATLWRMGYRLPKRHPARAIPDLIEHLIQEIEKRDAEAVEAHTPNAGS